MNSEPRSCNDPTSCDSVLEEKERHVLAIVGITLKSVDFNSFFISLYVLTTCFNHEF